MSCGSGQGCGSGGGCGTENSCSSSENYCSKDEQSKSNSRLCLKCKEEPTVDFDLCHTCLHTNLLSKFKTAVNKNSLVTPVDNVLLAFSGGPASRVALEILREIRLKAQTDLDASRDQAAGVFGLGVVFVDETAALSATSRNSERNIEEISSIVLSASERRLPLHIAKLQDLFSEKNCFSSVDGSTNEEMDDCVMHGCLAHSDEIPGTRNPEERLQELLGYVKDVTGKEDLVTYLRMQVLQKVAKEHGYTKLVLGVCSSLIAARAIAATAKGQGYAFPADIQYVDSRWAVTVVLPLRDCLARELDVYCRLANLKTVSIKTAYFATDKMKSINELSQVFVSLLQEQNFSREYTIARTMGKLKPFEFNAPPVGPIEVALRRRRGMETPTIVAGNGVPDLFCPIRSAPLDVRDFLNGDGGVKVSIASDRDASSMSPDELKSTCCPSCSFQIISKEPNAEALHKILPEAMRERALTNVSNKQRWMRREETKVQNSSKSCTPSKQSEVLPCVLGPKEKEALGGEAWNTLSCLFQTCVEYALEVKGFGLEKLGELLLKHEANSLPLFYVQREKEVFVEDN